MSGCKAHALVTILYHGQSIIQIEILKPLPGRNAVLLIIPKKVHTLATQYHYMKIIKRTNFLNPGQTPNDTYDQPVYALTKETK